MSNNTVAKLLVDAGHACTAYQDKALRNLPCKRVQMDEIWSFVYAKNANVSAAKNAPPAAGDVWTWTALCADTKLLVSWLLADRSSSAAVEFVADLRGRFANRVQLTSDGYKPYLAAVDDVFGLDVDYAMLVKLYGADPQAETRYPRQWGDDVLRMLVTGGPPVRGGGGMPQRIMVNSRSSPHCARPEPDNQETRPASATGCRRTD